MTASTEIRLQIDERLAQELEARLAAGEFSDMTGMINEMIRYYVDRHQVADWEDYVRSEIAWSRRATGTS